MIKKLFAAVMAMAMVVSVAPAKAALTGPTTACPAADKATAAVVNAYVEKFAEEVDLETVKLTDEFDFDGGEDITVTDVLELEADWNADGTKASGETLEDALAVADGCLSAEAKYLKGLVAAVATYAGLEAFYETMLEEDTGLLTVGYETEIETEVKAMALLETLTEYKTKLTVKKVSPALAYVGNVEDAEEMIEEIVEAIDEVIEIIADAYDVELASAYYESFLALLDGEGLIEVTTSSVTGVVSVEVITIDELPTWEKAGKRTGTTYDLGQLIAAIEADKAGLDGSYEDYEEEVEELMAGLEDLLAQSEELDELVKEAKELAITEKIGKAAVNEAKSVTGETYTKNTTWDEVFADADLEALYADLNPAEFEILVEYVEFLHENFFETTYTKKGSRWIVDLNETEFEPHMDAVLDAAGIEDLSVLVAELEGQYVDDLGEKTELTEYEVLVDYMAAVVEAYEAATEGVKGVTVNNLSSKNIDAVIAAKEALADIEDYEGNLTAAQLKAVAKNEENIGVLYMKALFSGVTTAKTTGWVELGNGNWDYYDANGNVYTGWVAAGSNWYYVSNGHMLRNTWVAKDATGAVWYYLGTDGAMVSNTVVDGYAINANGEWVK